MSEVVMFADAYASIDSTGILSMDGQRPWDAEQSSACDVRRDQVLARPYPNFGKLTIADKLAFAAACLIMPRFPDLRGARVGISVGLPFGSLSTDVRYMESVVAGFPSPAIFSATLPSSVIAEIAICFGLKGPNRVVSEGDSSGLCALEAAVRVLNRGKADAVLVAAVTAWEPQDAETPLTGGILPSPCAAHALLLSRSKLPGGCAMRLGIRLEARETHRETRIGDVYFHSLVEKIHSREAGAIEVATERHVGTLLLEKDD